MSDFLESATPALGTYLEDVAVPLGITVVILAFFLALGAYGKWTQRGTRAG